MQETSKSRELFERAEKVIPGGVNSPVRAFKAVGGEPLFIKSARGAYLNDQDGNAYIDLFNSWGPMVLGHAQSEIKESLAEALEHSFSFGAPTRVEVEIAELISEMVPSIELVRMVNSGTEATMSAIRLARGFTQRTKIIKFAGCYHGHGDSFLIAAGSGALTMGTPDSPGVTPGVAQDTLIARYNHLESVTEIFNANAEEIAAVIVEPVAGNMGCIPPEPGFLPGLRKICTQYGALLIFDEVMTGFRLAPGGAQELYQVTPDITTLGKIIGGGLPVGAYGGSREVMEHIAPSGPVYQAGTLSGNPLAMTAGLTMLKKLQSEPGIYKMLAKATSDLADGMRSSLNELGLKYSINQVGSMLTLFFSNHPVRDYDSAKSTDTKLFGRYFREMLGSGMYIPPSQFESWFISTAITPEIIEHILEAHHQALKNIH